MSKRCPCQFGTEECSFPDCYTKDELVNAIEEKNKRIAELEAPVTDGEIVEAIDGLDAMSNEHGVCAEYKSLITRLARENMTLHKWPTWKEQCDHIHALTENRLTLQARIAELEERERWIPVSERLPDVEGRYRTYGYNPGGTYWSDEKHYFRNGHFIIGNSYEPTHWKPIHPPEDKTDG